VPVSVAPAPVKVTLAKFARLAPPPLMPGRSAIHSAEICAGPERVIGMLKLQFRVVLEMASVQFEPLTAIEGSKRSSSRRERPGSSTPKAAPRNRC